MASLPRKRMLHAHGRRIVFARGNLESAEHVLGKVLLWALYLPQYPNLTVEISIGDRYKPDVVELDGYGKPIFWGESGVVGERKLHALVSRYRDTHFAMAKWDRSLTPYVRQVREALDGVPRSAPFDLIRFPSDSADRFIDRDGNVTLTHDDVEWVRL